ncbi:Transcriptional regulator SlyA (plasmid) [Sulfitobacter sp. THAF37]|uniref:MarR family winged helix-turn-helix transcriptional regulator n=1 Tax=Sulfitobacter sp. THAF37 TaxID=2587855 RepID=UPI0012696627|nr:MarR family winged helix-turn-helix transcriptional regulator [Sulfitobacter sp. THAF37]QFT60779.1 Transcriptional regulator SlyA [Sulfitobacter sp. THAF37]
MPSKIDPESPGFLVSTTARLMRGAFEREIERAQIGVTAGEARVLAHMSVCGGMRQNILADRLGCAPMSVSAFLDRLERAGLIERGPDPDDRRAKIVRLTAAAGPILTQIQLAGEEARKAAFAGVRPEDFEVFRAVCLQLRANLEEPRGARAAAEVAQ